MAKIRVFLDRAYAYDSKILVIDATEVVTTSDALVFSKESRVKAVIFRDYIIGYEWVEEKDDKS